MKRKKMKPFKAWMLVDADHSRPYLRLFNTRNNAMSWQIGPTLERVIRVIVKEAK